MRTLTIIISNKPTGETYHARSYPHDDRNNNGLIELYGVPVYKVFLVVKGKPRKEWRALRFMPYWNNPKAPEKKYKSRGWVNAGLSGKIHRKVVERYFPKYGVQNRYSPHQGAIQIRGNYLIHSGPQKLSEAGWGAAGCVEIVGDFSKFKQDIRDLAEVKVPDVDRALTRMVNRGKLLLTIQPARAPRIRKNFIGEAFPQ
ncbi:MAG: hypothetical protein AAFR61_03010 [Bacteroidota bacterium]